MAYCPSKKGLVQFIYRDDRDGLEYGGVLTVEFGQEEDQWVGLCHELGNAAQADTLAQVEIELLEAIDLQLNETARLCDVREYLADNEVELAPISMPREMSFSVAGRVLTKQAFNLR